MTDLVNNGYAGVFGHNIGVPPDDVPKVASFIGLALVANVAKVFDLRDLIETHQINNLQSVYIDNDTASRVILSVANASGHRIIALPQTQGWYPLPVLDNMAVQLVSPGNVSINLAFANVSIIAGPWKTA